MGDLPKLVWSRDVTGRIDNIHSNLNPPYFIGSGDGTELSVSFLASSNFENF